MGSGLIINRDFAYAPDQALQLRHAEYARRMIYGNGWSRLRLGLLCGLERTPSPATFAGSLFFGVGTYGSPISSYATQNFFGISLCSTAAPGSTQTWTYNAGSSGNDYFTPAVGQVFQKYSTSYVNKETLAAGAYLPIGRDMTLVSSQSRRAVFILDITRPRGGSGDGVVSVYCTATSQVANDFRADHMFDAMDRTGTPTLLGTAMTVLENASAITIGEEFGPLDTIMLYWSRSAIALEVYAIGANMLFSGEYEADISGPVPERPAQAGAWFSFEGFSQGTLNYGADQDTNNGQFLTTTGTLEPNSGWAGTFLSAGSTGYRVPTYYPLNTTGTAVAFFGTSFGWPLDDFSYYGTGTASPTVTPMILGNGWTSYGTFYGTSNPAWAETGYSGTAAAWPYDAFNLYSVGTVGAGVTLNGGVTWASDGIILT